MALASAPKLLGFYLQTCTDISISSSPNSSNQFTLSATCRTASGGTKKTTLAFNVNNCDGNLTWDPNNTHCPPSQPW